MNLNFEGQRILVTGAGRDVQRCALPRISAQFASMKELTRIGRQLCITLAKSSPKVKVFALAKTQSNLDSLKAEFPNIETICVDLGDWNATRLAVESVLPIDGLVNNAGTSVLAPMLETTPEMIDMVFNINVKAAVNVTQVVAGDMKRRNVSGSIVNVSSQASQAALKDHLVYCGSKGALDMMTKVMALELGAHNIRCNCINPTVILTEMGKLAWSDPDKARPMLEKIPLGRFAEVDDVIGSILFLLSERAAMINGICLPIDGGFLAT